MFYTRTLHTSPPKYTPSSDGMVRSAAAWYCLQSAHTNHMLAAGVTRVHIAFFVPGDLTFDLNLQTRPSEGPNTSSLWILRKSVQPFPRYLSDKLKKQEHQQACKTQIPPYGLTRSPSPRILNALSTHDHIALMRASRDWSLRSQWTTNTAISETSVGSVKRFLVPGDLDLWPKMGEDLSGISYDVCCF